MRLVLLAPAAGDREGGAAVAWARAGGYEPRVVDARGTPWCELEGDVVLWCHAGDAVPTLADGVREEVRRWVHEGGGLLLTLLATPLARALGGPDETPVVHGPRAWVGANDPLHDPAFHDWPDFPHIRGVQGWGEHPLFDGLQRGTFTWRATEGEPVARTFFRRPRWPAGEVIAVDRAYVRLDADAAVAWEYRVGAGRILCLGANVDLSAADQGLAAQRDRYLVNAIASLDPRRTFGASRGATWPRTYEAPRDRSVGYAPPIVRPRPLAARRAWPDFPLSIDGAAESGRAFTLAGRRTLVVGDEGAGVRECWIHPLCVAEAFAPRVDGAPLRAEWVTVTPGAVVRTLRDVGGRAWRETIAVSQDGGALHYEFGAIAGEPDAGDSARGDAARGAAGRAVANTLDPTAAASHGAAATLDVTLRLRLQWPHAGDALQPLTAALEREGASASVVVRGADARMQLRVAVGGIDAARLEASTSAPRLHLRAAAGEPLRLAVVATTEGEGVAARQWAALPADAMDDVLARRAACDRSLLARTTAIATPDPAFDQAWRWATARLSAFLLEVPGVGTGLAAGYAASRPGWGDSRPGYAWFFGRDACWSADALLAAGMFAEARVALEFLAQGADVTGKIVHEVSTSGVAHYDAADSTPLWLRLVATYADWTGDLATVRAHWDQVRAAFAFVRGTDRDGDGLPENTGVGHGWVESGPLGGGAVTAYVAALWIDATRRLAPLATALGDVELAARADAAVARATDGLARRLRNPSTGRLVLQLDAEGRPTRERTALDAVPVLLGVDTGEPARAVVADLASGDWCAPWGVRMLSRRDARYRPTGYHSGAVWPLFTGWTSLAAYRCGMGATGWQLLSKVGALATARARGAFDEVLDGESGGSAGICPDQAWSAAMLIAPTITGMLGLRPDAPARRCALDPAWPADWPSARVSGLRVGGSRFAVTMSRPRGWCGGEGAGDVLELALESGPPLHVAIAGVEGSGDDDRLTVVQLEAGTPRIVHRPGRRGGDDGRR